MDDAGHRVAANPCGSHLDRQEQPDHITGSLIVLLTTASHPKEPEQVPNEDRQATATYPAGWPRIEHQALDWIKIPNQQIKYLRKYPPRDR